MFYVENDLNFFGNKLFEVVMYIRHVRREIVSTQNGDFHVPDQTLLGGASRKIPYN